MNVIFFKIPWFVVELFTVIVFTWNSNAFVLVAELGTKLWLWICRFNWLSRANVSYVRIISKNQSNEIRTQPLFFFTIAGNLETIYVKIRVNTITHILGTINRINCRLFQFKVCYILRNYGSKHGCRKVATGKFCHLGILPPGILPELRLFKFYFRRYNIT